MTVRCVLENKKETITILMYVMGIIVIAVIYLLSFI